MHLSYFKISKWMHFGVFYRKGPTEQSSEYTTLTALTPLHKKNKKIEKPCTTKYAFLLLIMLLAYSYRSLHTFAESLPMENDTSMCELRE